MAAALSGYVPAKRVYLSAMLHRRDDLTTGETPVPRETPVLRDVRKRLTSWVSHVSLSAAPALTPAMIDAFEAALAVAGPNLPVLSRIVAENMRAAGVYSRAVHRDYFARVAAHLAGALHVFRHVRLDASRPVGMNDALAAVAEERIRLDDSVDGLRQAAQAGRGVIIMGAHAVNFVLGLARLNQVVPITVYLRHTRDARRLTAKRRWCQTTGLDFIAEPARLTDPTSRAARMAEALGRGRVLVITPDLPQKRGAGVAVRLFDREICLPAGAAALSLVTASPLFTLVGRPMGPATCITLHGPFSTPSEPRGRGWRREAIRRRLQWFTDHLADFLRANPAMWFLWGDRRWTRVWHGDPRYVSAPTPRAFSARPSTSGVNDSSTPLPLPTTSDPVLPRAGTRGPPR
jgi:lauroyl/myristoyl acyltransferase